MPTLYLVMVFLSCSQNGCPAFWSPIQTYANKEMCDKYGPADAESHVAGDGLKVIKWKCVQYKPAK
jgi:hypothetical protein